MRRKERVGRARNDVGARVDGGRSEEELVVEQLDLVRRIARAMARRVRWADVQDLEAEGLIGLVRAVRTWHPARTGVSLAPWASTFVRRAMVDSLRRERGHRFQREAPESLDRPLGGSGSTLADVVVDPVSLSSRLAAREQVARVLALESRRAFVLMGRYVGLSDVEIAERLGVSGSRVSALAQDGRRRLGRAVYG